MTNFLTDLRYAYRSLRSRPGFSFAAVLVLALGIGPNTAIFSVVNAVLLRPLPYPSPERIMQVWHVPPPKNFPGMSTFSVSPANYLDWESQNHSFERMAAYRFRNFAVTGADRAEELRVAAVGPDFFSVLRTKPVLGHAFLPEEHQSGHDRAVILSDLLWRTRFGGDPHIVGQSIRLDQENYTVAGVMSAKIRFPDWAQAWVPLVWTSQERAVRDNHNYFVIGRLKPGVPVQNAQAELDTISARLAEQYPVEDKGWGAVIVPLHAQLVGDIRPALLLLLGAVAFVLLIACANVANLVLAKTMSRQKELAIRSALGAGRARILQQMLSETLLLSLAGGVAGLFLAQFALEFITRLLADKLPHSMEIQLDGWVLVFTLLVSLVTGLLSGLLPALHFSKRNLNDALKQGLGRTDSDTVGVRTRALLVTSEVALSLILLVGAGLMIRSLWALRSIHPGFEARNVLTAQLTLSRTQYSTGQGRVDLFDRILERVGALPGVEAAGLIDNLPVSGRGSTQPFSIEGRPVLPMSEQPEVAVRAISPGYVNAMGIPLVAGRNFSDGDAAGRPSVVQISQSLAKRFWPGDNPLGKRITLTFMPGVVREVVGIVGDVKQDALSSSDTRATIYLPYAQVSYASSMALVLRSTTSPESQASALAAAVQSLDPNLPVVDIMTMQHLIDESLSPQRFNLYLLASFAGLALFLATAGIYGVLSYMVQRRFREIGIRMALGALNRNVLGMVVLEGAKPILLGILVGTGGALALGRAVASLIYGVKASDFLTFAAVVSLLAAAGIAASLFPAWRATRVDPIRILREE